MPGTDEIVERMLERGARCSKTRARVRACLSDPFYLTPGRVMMSVACFGGFLGASERVLDNADRILARASRTRSAGGRWRARAWRALALTHGAMYCLWFGHRPRRGHAARYRAELIRRLPSLFEGIRLGQPWPLPAGAGDRTRPPLRAVEASDLYLECALTLRTRERPLFPGWLRYGDVVRALERLQDDPRPQSAHLSVLLRHADRLARDGDARSVARSIPPPMLAAAKREIEAKVALESKGAQEFEAEALPGVVALREYVTRVILSPGDLGCFFLPGMTYARFKHKRGQYTRNHVDYDTVVVDRAAVSPGPDADRVRTVWVALHRLGPAHSKLRFPGMRADHPSDASVPAGRVYAFGLDVPHSATVQRCREPRVSLDFRVVFRGARSPAPDTRPIRGVLRKRVHAH